MKKFSLYRIAVALVMTLLLPIVLQAQRMLDVQNETFDSELTSPEVTRSIESTSYGYRVTYDFDKVLLMPDDLYEGTEKWTLGGFIHNEISGESAYPYNCDTFAIPSGSNVRYSIVEEDWLEVFSSPAPARESLIVSATEGYTKENVPAVAISNSWIPSNTLSDDDVIKFGNTDLVSIVVTPVQFNSATGKARICRHLTYDIIIEDPIAVMSLSDDSPVSYDGFEEEILSRVSLNWDLKASGKPKRVVGGNGDKNSKNYLMIAPESLKGQVETFADWKRQIGFNVITRYSASWTTDQIDQVINEVRTEQGKLSYLMLVGNHDLVPGKLTYHSGFTAYYVSDLKYALLASNLDTTSSSAIPTVRCGRLPINNSVEAAAAFEKIRWYESKSDEPEGYYNTSYFISDFIDLDNNGAADMTNCQRSYELVQYLKELGRTAKYSFKAEFGKTPLKWGTPTISRTSDGKTVVNTDLALPEELRFPKYKWLVTSSVISNTILEGASQVVYFGHGNSTTWNSPQFTNENVSNLSNENGLSVVYSMACLTGNHTVANSLANAFIANEYGGAVGMFGFTHNTWTSYTDVILASLFNGMWPNPGYYPMIYSCQLPVNSNVQMVNMGELWLYALAKLHTTFVSDNSPKSKRNYQTEIFTLFGDPSMDIFIKKPEKIKASVTCLNRSHLEITAPSTSTISIYNTRSKEAVTLKGGTCSYDVPANKGDFIVTIYESGKLPYQYSVRLGFAMANAHKPASLIDEDRVWRYSQRTNVDLPDDTQESEINLCFEGTTVVDDMEYHVCKAWSGDINPAPADKATIAYMREEGGKVYMRYPENFDARKIAEVYNVGVNPSPLCGFNNFYVSEGKYNSETLIYDFTLKGNDAYYVLPENQFPNNRIDVVGILDYSYDNENYGVQILRPNELNKQEDDRKTGENVYQSWQKWVYSLHNVGANVGLLPFPGAHSLIYGYDTQLLIGIYDREGNLLLDAFEIFKNASQEVDDYMASVEDIDSDREVTTEYFDLNGNKIVSPQKGICIKTERHSNGTVKTTKVVL